MVVVYPFDTQKAADRMKNVQLWLANNEKVRYIDSFIFYSMYIVTISTLGGVALFGKSDKIGTLSIGLLFLLNDLFPFEQIAHKSTVYRSNTIPIVS